MEGQSIKKVRRRCLCTNFMRQQFEKSCRTRRPFEKVIYFQQLHLGKNKNLMSWRDKICISFNIGGESFINILSVVYLCCEETRLRIFSSRGEIRSGKNNQSKYYWVDKKGHRHFVTKAELKDKVN